ncbi:hypothetical protein P7C71_g2002, partial [Lecanoromycetidae sp. Uapishka_2]
MYFSTITLLGFLASTLALPSSLHSSAPNHPLEKRQHYGWIGAYEDATCGGDYQDTRPELQKSGTCHTWSPHGPFIGVNYGTGLLAFGNAQFFSDALCQEPSTALLTSTDPNNPASFPSNQVQKSRFPSGFACVPLSNYTAGVQSVLGH